MIHVHRKKESSVLHVISTVHIQSCILAKIVCRCVDSLSGTLMVVLVSFNRALCLLRSRRVFSFFFFFLRASLARR